MGFSRGQWVDGFLRALGNTNAGLQTRQFVAGWSAFETGANLDAGAKFNLLNTTQPAEGATNFNVVGVKNYQTYEQGIQANVQTLKNGRYPVLLNAVTNNVLSQLKDPSAAMIAELDTWGTGYKVNFIALGTARYNDTATYGNFSLINPGQKAIEVKSEEQQAPTPDACAKIGDPIARAACYAAIGAAQTGTQVTAFLQWATPQNIGKLVIGTGLVLISVYFIIQGSLPGIKSIAKGKL